MIKSYINFTINITSRKISKRNASLGSAPISEGSRRNKRCVLGCGGAAEAHHMTNASITAGASPSRPATLITLMAYFITSATAAQRSTPRPTAPPRLPPPAHRPPASVPSNHSLIRSTLLYRIALPSVSLYDLVSSHPASIGIPFKSFV